jgi:Ca-activated chloride channel family protein
VADVAKKLAEKPGDAGRARFGLENDKLGKVEKELEQLNKALDAEAKDDAKDRTAGGKGDEKVKREVAERMLRSVQEAKQNLTNYEQARQFYAKGQYRDAQAGQVGVDVAVCANNLRTQDRLTRTANRLVQGRNCLEVGGLWIDEGFTANMKTLVVKAQSDAYFKILEKKPEMKDVFRMGNHLVFVTPSQTALVIDTSDGKDKLTDEEVAALFVAKK